MSHQTRKLREVMLELHSIGSDESIRTAAFKMSSEGLSAVSVLEGNRVVGLLTSRDLVAKILAIGINPDEAKVSEVMNCVPVRISDDRDLESALLVMRALGCHELLVQDFTGRVVGLFCKCGCCDQRSVP